MSRSETGPAGGVHAVDLDGCHAEPIHIIGHVQPYGCLLAVNEVSGAIDYVSANSAAFLGRAPDGLLGQPAECVLGAVAGELAGRVPEPTRPEMLRPWFFDAGLADGTARPLECNGHRHAGHYILEFIDPDPAPGDVWEQDRLRQNILAELTRPDTLWDLARASARVIRDVTGFDRVMIYRFAEDLHGEVIAESTDRADSFLGLHYPASDIPAPARRHFLLNLIRAIPDINAVPVAVHGRGGAVADASSSAPLDLTYSKLRGVAPVHVQYLSNMGVRASMSISLTANDRLWGLVACHHYGPLQVPSSRLRFAELIGGTISALLQSHENTMHLRQGLRAERVAFDIEQQARAGRPLQAVVTETSAVLCELLDAQGLVLQLEGQRLEIGAVPRPLPDFTPLARLLSDGVAASDNASALVPMDASQRARAAGAAYLELSEDGADHLILLREEYEQTINWAGRPEKLEERAADGRIRLTPRGSFELWCEERRGFSKPFSEGDGEVLRITRRALFAVNSLLRERRAIAAQKAAEAARERMHLALLDAARKSSLGELASALAHELTQPLSAVTNYVNACRQELRNVGVTVPGDVAALMDDAVGESSRAADLVRRLRNFIAQGELVADAIDVHEVARQGIELALAASPGEAPRLTLDFAPDLPKAWADPVQIGQVVLNLVRNSLQAMRGVDDRHLIVATRHLGALIEVSVRDSGPGIGAEAATRLFEPFHSSTTEGMGIGLSLCRSIVEAHAGHIGVRSHDVGAELVFTLPVARTGAEHGG